MVRKTNYLLKINRTQLINLIIVAHYTHVQMYSLSEALSGFVRTN